MKIADSVMRGSWQTLIAKVEKYYPNAKNPDFEQWHFIISPKKQWMFDVLNRVWCNMDIQYEWHEPSHPILRQYLSHGDGYTDLEKKVRYTLQANGRYYNGNTLVIIKKENWG